jgi:predicted MFS family arabinose efflux permease
MLIALFSRKRDRILLLPVIGAQLIIGTSLFLLPVLIEVLRVHAGLSEKSAGLLLSMELATAALTTICLTMCAPAHSARRWALNGGCLTIASTALTIVSPSLPILVTSRFLAGLGAGIIGAEATSVLSRVWNRERMIAIVTIMSIVDGAILLAALPYIIDVLGYRAPYICLLLVCSAGTLLLARLPNVRQTVRSFSKASSLPNALPSILVVTAVFLTQLGQGTFWSMVGRYGASAGFSSHAIGAILSISTALLLLGAVGAAWVGDRYGRFSVLFFLIAVNAVAILVVGTVPVRSVFIVANIVQSITNLSSVIYQLGLSASLDRFGRTVAVSTAVVALGNGIGPGLSASFSGLFGASSVAVLVVGLNGAALALYCLVMMRQAEEQQMAPSLT